MDTTRCLCRLLAAFVFLVSPISSQARNDAPTEGEGHAWHGDIREFAERDLSYWRSGVWVREVHNGRGGWWWLLGDTWYPYERVSYPYPDPYTPSPLSQPTVIGKVSDVPLPELKPPFYFYYCERSNTYYPYAASCPSGWKSVRAAQRDIPRAAPRPAPLLQQPATVYRAGLRR